MIANSDDLVEKLHCLVLREVIVIIKDEDYVTIQ